MSTNLTLPLFMSLSMAIAMAGVALWSGWGILGAFLIYSLGGSLTLFLTATIGAYLPQESDSTGR